jgi:Transglutaminase-like superfamily
MICHPHVPQPKISLRNIPEGYSGTLRTVEHISALIKQGAKDFHVRQTAIDILLRRGVRPKDYLGEIKALFEWVQQNVRYTKDTFRVEVLHSARRMLELRAGDCDDMAILLGAMLESVGHPVRLVLLRIKQAGERGGAASIRIDDPNPDIEFVETGLTGPDPGAGKFEIAVQADQLQINGRKADVSPDKKGFETIVVFQRPAAGGNIGIGFPEAHFKKFGGGKGVIVIANASVAPSPSKKLAGAGILYVEDGALKYMGSNGTVTVIAPA